MTNYLSTSILDFTEPDRADGTEDVLDRRILELSGGTGTRTVDVPGPADAAVRSFAWLCFSRAEVKTLRTFIESCLGRGVPFWLQTWEEDFTLASDHVADSIALTVLGASYSALVFPNGRQRRHIGVRAPGGAFNYRQIMNAVDNLDGTETLTLSASITDALPAAGTFISFLRYSRLDTDTPEIEWDGGYYARCLLPVRELPNETIGQ